MGAHASNWHPLTWLSHMADCDLFRLNPGGPHLVNVLFHSLNAALLFVLLFRLTGKIWPSAFVGALFAWHPLHVESVAWIAERKDVLSTFFALLTLLSYTRFVREKRRRRLLVRPAVFRPSIAVQTNAGDIAHRDAFAGLLAIEKICGVTS